METREFRPEDAEAVSKIMQAAFKTFLRDKWDKDDERHFSPEVITRNSFRQADFVKTAAFVAVDGSTILGYVCGTAGDNGLGVLEVIGVDPDIFHKGVGKALLSRLEQFWYEHKQRKVRTCVSAHNTRALIYYLSNGFIPVGYRKDHFRIGVDEIELDRFLK